MGGCLEVGACVEPPFMGRTGGNGGGVGMVYGGGDAWAAESEVSMKSKSLSGGRGCLTPSSRSRSLAKSSSSSGIPVGFINGVAG